MMGSLFAMSVAALLVVGAQFWYIIVRFNNIIINNSDDDDNNNICWYTHNSGILYRVSHFISPGLTIR